MPVWLIVLIAVLFGVAIFVVLAILVTRLSRKSARRWAEENPDKEILLSANGANCLAFPGEKITLRGNGLLVLTPEELHFRMWAPEKILELPLQNIVSADLVKSFAGRRGRFPLLHITFHGGDGRIMETAWSVVAPKDWARRINELKGRESD